VVSNEPLPPCLSSLSFPFRFLLHATLDESVFNARLSLLSLQPQRHILIVVVIQGCNNQDKSFSLAI